MSRSPTSACWNNRLRRFPTDVHAVAGVERDAFALLGVGDHVHLRELVGSLRVAGHGFGTCR